MSTEETPADVIDHAVHKAWRAHLPTEDFTVHDNFTRLGGTSMLAIRIIADLRRELKTGLPLTSIFEAPTIHGLAELIRRRSRSLERSYVPMTIGHPNGKSVIHGKTAFVFVHPVGGAVSGYWDVVQGIPQGIECVGLQARGLDLECEPHVDIPTMASQYLSEVLAHHAAEDVVLSGYSFGGLVAYEMAHQLEQEGRLPAGLLLLDTHVPDQNDSRPSRIRDLRALAAAIYRLPIAQLESNGEDVDDREVVRKIIDVARHCGTLPEEYNHEGLPRLIEVLALNHRMSYTYEVPDYKHDIHLIRPAGSGSGDALHAWSKRCSARFVTHDIGGENHYTLMSGVHGNRIAQLLAELWLR
ncbi:thioesterase domain-containing protein [Streptomyces rochei]|uniref:thioesterase domain-containing protein n=1 Tax=Streptomyces rochei TaxID=1928 RepID=UPI0036D0C512